MIREVKKKHRNGLGRQRQLQPHRRQPHRLHLTWAQARDAAVLVNAPRDSDADISTIRM